LEREKAMRNWRKTDPVVFSGLFFFDYFLLEEQKKVMNKFPSLQIARPPRAPYGPRTIRGLIQGKEGVS